MWKTSLSKLCLWHTNSNTPFTWGLPLWSLSSCIWLYLYGFVPCSCITPQYAPYWLKLFRKLGCLAPVLTPTFPIVWLGRKGSTSVIVTTGSSELVPQTGWSRKLAILKDIIGRRRRKWKFWFINTIEFRNFPQTKSSIFSSHIDWRWGFMIMISMTTQRKEPIAGLFSLEDVSYIKK